MTRDLRKSNAQLQRAKGKLPLGVSSNFRYWGEEKTIYVAKGKGARVWDIDGNEYIDYRLGYGPVILGYGDPRVDQAAKEGMEIGGVFALGTEGELELAERISRMVKSAELVRFSNSGTEAVMAALRIARAYTGKDSYVVIEGGYHGLFDAALWYTEMEEWSPGDPPPELVPYSEGVPSMLKRLIHTVPMNDANALEDVLKKHSSEIGALLIEPIMGNCCSITADLQFIKDVRELCTRYDVVMICDEVKTGFRVARGGVQELMGFEADLCTFAKAVANGYPISVVAGREQIMRQIGENVAHGGTFTAHAVALAAANKTLDILENTDALETIAGYGEQLQAGISKILTPRGIPHCFVGHPSMGGLFFAENPPADYRDWASTNYEFYDTLAPYMHDLGILCEPDSREPWFICESHAKGCLDETLQKFEQSVDMMTADHPGILGS